ncbi:putative Motility protein B-like N-terminal domain-containing protein [uncultured Gammaproteobacteria bacterium]
MPSVSRSPVQPIGRGTAQMFLSLFLLLLVFFVVFNAQSKAGGHRTQAALGSVGRSFAPVRVLVDEAGASGWGRALLSAASGELSQIGAVLGGEIADIHLEERPAMAPMRGRVLVVTLSSDSLFLPGTATVRPERAEFFTKLAQALDRHPSGMRLEAEFLAGFDADTRDQPGHPGSVARAAAFVQALLAVGAPLSAVSIGLEAGQTGTARLMVTARLLDDTALTARGVATGTGARSGVGKRRADDGR